jgi:hypothetical protein
MLASLTSKQVAEWMAFNNVEGIGGEPAENFRAGQICSTVANFSTWEIKEPFKGADFIPMLDEDRKSQEPILLDDPKEHAKLIMSQVFGTTMEAAYGKKKNG